MDLANPSDPSVPPARGDQALLQQLTGLVPSAPPPPAMAPGPQRGEYDDARGQKRPRGNGLLHPESVDDGRAWSLSSGAPLVPRCLHKWTSAQAYLFEFDLTAYRSLLQRASEVAKPMLVVHPPLGLLYGKPAFMRRNVGFFCEPGDSYGYFFSGQLAKANPLPPELRHLLATVNDRFNARYNGILVNYYASGEDYISDHRDDELGLDPSAGVLTISYGAERKFVVKKWNHAKNAPHPNKESPWVRVLTRSCHALLMAGADFQTALSHGIPPQSGAGWRISYTFRVHDKEKEEALYAAWMRRQERLCV